MLRPTFMGFDIAKRGIQVSQKGLDIVGQNMTNWDSVGYTRQRVDLTAISPSTYSQRYATNRIGVAGQGVDITGISQIRDSFLDKRFRDENAELGYNDQAAALLADIEAAISEYLPDGNSGIRYNLQSIFSALQQFAETPYSETHANIVATEIKNLTQTLHALSSKMDNVEQQQKYNLGIAVDDVNQILMEIAGLNHAISQDTGLSIGCDYYKPNELYDQRNVLFDKLSSYGNINLTEHADGSVTVKFGEMVVVDGKKYETLVCDNNSNGTIDLRWSSTGKSIDTGTGSLKAFSDFINGKGPNVTSQGETNAKGILYYREQLNIFASTFVGVVNNTVPDVDAAGNIVGYKELLGGMSSTPDASGKYIVSKNIPVTASNISLSDMWAADASYIIPVEDLKENNYILELYSKLSAQDITFFGAGETYVGTFTEFVNSYSSVLAEDVSYYNNRADATATITNELEDKRDSVSGVIMDEEVTNMLMYNKSLQAASRLMTTLDEALDVLINKTGLVGR